MKEITINRNTIIAELRSAYRLSLSNRNLYHTIYLYDDGTTYDFTDCSNSSWLEDAHIVATIATYQPDVGGSCIDSYLYGLSASDRIDLYTDYMTDGEADAYRKAVESGDVDTDDICSIDSWMQLHTDAYDKVCEEAYDYETNEADSNGDFDRDLDEAISDLESNGYTVTEIDD